MSYAWSQTDLSVTVTFGCPLSTQESNVKIEITRDNLTGGLAGVVPVLNGPLLNPVEPRRSKWSVSSGLVTITLGKMNKVRWTSLFKAGRTPQPPETIVQKQVIVQWAYAAAEPGELDLIEGQIVTVLKEDASGWWEGTVGGKTGYFPENFTKPYEAGSDAAADDHYQPTNNFSEEPYHNYAAQPEPEPEPEPEPAPAPVRMMTGPQPGANMMAELAGRLTPRSNAEGPLSVSDPPPGAAFRGRGGPGAFRGGPRGAPGGAGAFRARQPIASAYAGSEALVSDTDSPSVGGFPRGGARPPIASSYGAGAGALGGGGEGAPFPFGARGGRGAAAGGDFGSRGRGSNRTTIAFGGKAPDLSAGGVGDGPGFGGFRRGAPQGAAAAAAAAGAGAVVQGAPPGLGRGQRAEMTQSEPPAIVRRATAAAGGAPGGAPQVQQQQQQAPAVQRTPAVVKPAAPPPEPRGKVSFPYTAEAEGEISFEIGDIVVIHEKDPSGWWSGLLERTGESGWFPSDFVDEIVVEKATLVLDEIVPTTSRLDVPRRAGNPGRRLPSKAGRKLGATVKTKSDASAADQQRPARSATIGGASSASFSGRPAAAGPAMGAGGAVESLSNAAAARAGGLRRTNTEKMQQPREEQPAFQFPTLRPTPRVTPGAAVQQTPAPVPAVGRAAVATPPVGAAAAFTTPDADAAAAPPRPVRRVPSLVPQHPAPHHEHGFAAGNAAVSPAAMHALGGRSPSSSSAAAGPAAASSSTTPATPAAPSSSWKNFPSFDVFCKDVSEIAQSASRSLAGKLPMHPWLGRATRDTSVFGVAVVSCNGEIFQHGDTAVRFTIEELAYPFLYAEYTKKVGAERTKSAMGTQPTDQPANAMILNDENNPHNPFMNSGAMVMLSSLHEGSEDCVRIANVLSDLASLDGFRAPMSCLGCSMPSYIASNINSDINFALAFWLHSQQKLGSKDAQAQLALFYQARSIELNCLELASLGATLANNGKSVGPHGREALPAPIAKNTVEIVRSCGMAAASRSWATRKALPCKTSISGALLIIVPNRVAIAVYSPLLDSQLNSVRGLHFLSELLDRYGPLD